MVDDGDASEPQPKGDRTEVAKSQHIRETLHALPASKSGTCRIFSPCLYRSVNSIHENLHLSSCTAVQTAYRHMNSVQDLVHNVLSHIQ